MPRSHAISSVLMLAALLAGCQTNSDSRAPEADEGRPENPRLESQTSAANVYEGVLRHELALPTGNRKTSAVLLEMLAPDEARLNREFDYRFRVTNLTDAPLVNVNVREKRRDSFAITKSEPTGTEEGGWLTYHLEELGPAASKTIQISGIAKSQDKLTTCVAVDYRPTLCVGTTVVNPIIKLTKEGPKDAIICERISYRYVVSNVGTGTETDVTVEDKLPEGVLTDDGKKEVVIRFGDVPASTSKERIVRVKPQHPGQYTSAAVAHAPGGVEVRSQEISTSVHEPKLEIMLTGAATEYVNKTASYTVTIKNTGDAAAKRTVLGFDSGEHGRVGEVAIVDTADTARVAGARQGFAYRPEGVDLDTIAPGETKTVKVDVRAISAGRLHLTTSALATCVAPVTKRMTTEIIALPALRLEMVDLDDPIRVGEDVVYRVTVKNQGTGADKNIVLTATLPPGLEYVSSTGPTEAKLDGQTLRFGTVETLAAEKEIVWKIQAKATKAGDVLMRVQLKSDSLVQPASESEPTRLY